MELKAGGPFGLVARFIVVNACFESEDTLEEVHDLAKTPLKGSRDIFVCEDFPSLGFDDSVLPSLVVHSHASLFVHYPLSPSSTIFMSPLIILPFVTLMLIWAAMRISLMCLVEMLIILCP